MAATRLVEIITKELYGLEGFDSQYAEMIQAAAQDDTHGLSGRWEELRRSEAALERERDNVAAAIRTVGPHLMLKEELDGLDARANELARERGRLERLGNRKLIIPNSTTELRGLLEEEFRRLAIDSPEFGDLLRLLVPEFHVHLVRLCDGGALYPRARIKLDLAGSIADAAMVPGLSEMLTRVLTVDLFEAPQREAIREDSLRLIGEGFTYRQIAKQLKEQPKPPVVGYARDLDRLMHSMGLASPYITVLEPPVDFTKLRQYKNPKYRFEPLDGYQRPAL